MIWFSIIGLIALILGVLYIFFPIAIESLDKMGKKAVLTSEKMLEHRVKFGLFYLIAGIVLIYISFLYFK